MEPYFIRLFEYDHYASNAILTAMLQAGNQEKAVKVMGHLLAAQQIWLNRCMAVSPPAIALWPNLNAETLTTIMEQNTCSWLEYIATLKPEDFEQTVIYKNSKGQVFENKLADILTHVINHGTHHRAQAGQFLKAAGIEPLPLTDYIFYIRTK